MGENEILWRGLYLTGHEYARLEREGAEWDLNGVAVFSYESRPCRLEYSVWCNEHWLTARAAVRGSIAGVGVRVELAADEERLWLLNEEPCPGVNGCIDLDLNFSPSTNLLPIRRLALELGSEANVRAAWLRFPSFELEPLEQTYARLGHDRYRYSSHAGSFVAELRVNPMGFVTEYPGFWVAE